MNVTARGFEPPGVTVTVGGRVRFQNLDDRPHSIASNPVDTHSDCPPINEVGLLVPGQVKTTGSFREARTCNYHDELSEATVDPDVLTGHGLVRKGAFIKVLARGEISRKVAVHAHAVSKAAEAAITQAGGSVTLIPLPFKAEGKAGRPAAKGNQFTNR